MRDAIVRDPYFGHLDCRLGSRCTGETRMAMRWTRSAAAGCVAQALTDGVLSESGRNGSLTTLRSQDPN